MMNIGGDAARLLAFRTSRFDSAPTWMGRPAPDAAATPPLRAFSKVETTTASAPRVAADSPGDAKIRRRRRRRAR
jgi:hypothetical protein